MSVTRITGFRAHMGQGDALRDHLREFVPGIESSDGCRSCQLLQGEEDPTRVVVIEVWDSIEVHKAALKRIPPGAVEKTMQLLVEPPQGAYYHSS